MIEQAMFFLSEFLNIELKTTFGIDEDKVIVSGLADPDGSISQSVNNKVVMSLVNLEHIANSGEQGGAISLGKGGFAKKGAPIRMNMYVLVSANYDSSNYMEALKMLSSVIGIFQATSFFERKSNPNMHATLDKLSLEIVNVPLKEMSGIWSGVGSKYVPSVLYKVRSVTIDRSRLDGIIPEIAGLVSKADKKE